MKLELLTNATVVDKAIRFVSEKGELITKENTRDTINGKSQRTTRPTNQVF